MIDELDTSRTLPPNRDALLTEISAAREILAAVASAGTRYPGSLLSDCIAVQRKAALHLLKFPERAPRTKKTEI